MHRLQVAAERRSQLAPILPCLLETVDSVMVYTSEQHLLDVDEQNGCTPPWACGGYYNMLVGSAVGSAFRAERARIWMCATTIT